MSLIYKTPNYGWFEMKGSNIDDHHVTLLVNMLPLLNKMQGKSMLENESPQIVRECMSSYVGCLHDEHLILYVVVECFSN